MPALARVGSGDPTQTGPRLAQETRGAARATPAVSVAFQALAVRRHRLPPFGWGSRRMTPGRGGLGNPPRVPEEEP